MKRILLLMLIFLFPLKSCAFEDYIIVSENPVITVFSDDINIADIVPFYSIDNSKKSLFLKAKDVGKTIITIETTEGEAYLDIEVTEDKTIIPELENLKYFSLDLPKMKEELSKPKAGNSDSSELLIKDEEKPQDKIFDDYVPEKPVLREAH